MDANQQIPSGTIVVGVDTSATARRALEWAIHEAELEHRPLTLVHAVGNAVAACVAVERRDIGEVIEQMMGEGRRTLESAATLVSLISPQTVVRQVLRLSSPHQALMALADDAALLVVGPHSRGPRRDEAISSATELATPGTHGAPVVVAAGPAGTDGTDGTEGAGILVVLDGNALSRPTLELAFRHASRRHLPLTVVHCLADPADGGSDVDLWLMDSTARAEADGGPSLLGFQRSVLEVMVHELHARHQDVAVHVVLDDAVVDDVLQHACTTMDVVVLSSRHAMRASEGMFRDWDPATIRCVTVVQPTDDVRLADDGIERLMESTESRALASEVDELEAAFAEPAVDPLQQREKMPALVRRRMATRHLLHRMERQDRDR